MKNRINAAIAVLLLASLGWLLRKPASLTVYGTVLLSSANQTVSLAPDLLYAYHPVVAGESPFGIARRYGMNLTELRQLNGLTEHSVIHPGDQLLVFYYRSMLPRYRCGNCVKSIRVLSLTISEYDDTAYTVARGPSGKSPDYSSFHGHAPPGVQPFVVYKEGYLPKATFLQLLRDQVEATKAGELLVVQIAGHGEMFAGQWHLLLSDFERGNYDRLLSGKGLLQILSRAKGSVLLILDSCHSGAIAWDQASLKRKPDLAVITSCLPHEDALVVKDALGRDYGLFTLTWGGSSQEKAQEGAEFNFLDLLLGSQYRMENESWRYVNNRTLRHTWRQHPVVAIPPQGPFPFWN